MIDAANSVDLARDDELNIDDIERKASVLAERELQERNANLRTRCDELEATKQELLECMALNAVAHQKKCDELRGKLDTTSKDRDLTYKCNETLSESIAELRKLLSQSLSYMERCGVLRPESSLRTNINAILAKG